MENRRRCKRFSMQLNAQYSFEDTKKSWRQCTIVDATYNGIGIRFKTPEKIDAGSNIHLEILVSKELKPISIKGKLKWIGEGENNLVGGVELTEVLDEITWSNLIRYMS